MQIIFLKQVLFELKKLLCSDIGACYFTLYLVDFMTVIIYYYSNKGILNTYKLWCSADILVLILSFDRYIKSNFPNRNIKINAEHLLKRGSYY